MPRDIKHKLLTKDLQTMTGECQSCGPVKLRKRSGGRAGAPPTVACPTPKKEERAADMGRRKEWIYSVRTRSHGLTVDQAREFVRGKSCGICGSEEDLMVDHCHVTEKIRDALCRGCNSGLGFFRDDPLRLQAAIDYLKRHRAPESGDIRCTVTP